MSEVLYQNALNPGFELQAYQIEKVLGRGTFGIVYLAKDTALDRLVAIKEYLPSEFAIRDSTNLISPLSTDYKDQYAWGRDRFIVEARTLAKLEHPNIVRVLNVLEIHNTAYMIMQYEEGQSLQDILKLRHTLPETELLSLLLPLLNGLALVHEKGFIHRDIKPANIYIRNNGTPVLIDFGSARQPLAGRTTLTSVYSPGYAPFEQYQDTSDQQGAWTDIYSLAATLYKAISGNSPATALSRSHDLLSETTDSFIPALLAGAGRYSDTFLKAIDHALCFKITDRPQSIAQWQQEFSQSAFVTPRPLTENDETVVYVNSSGSLTNRRAKPVAATKELTTASTHPLSFGLWAVLALLLTISAGLLYWTYQQALATPDQIQTVISTTKINAVLPETPILTNSVTAQKTNNDATTPSANASKPAIELALRTPEQWFDQQKTWRVQRDASATPDRRCRLLSKSGVINDGHEETPIHLLLLSNEVMAVTSSDIDMRYPGIGLKVDDNSIITIDRTEQRVAAVFAGSYTDIIQQFIKGEKAYIALGFWPTWPMNNTQHATIDLRGFKAAYQGFLACQQQSAN